MSCRRWFTPRPGVMVFLGVVLLFGGSCGTSGGNSGSSFATGALVGGVLRPRPVWYALAPTSDPLVPIAGACEVPRDARALPRSVDLRRDGIIPPVQNQRWNSCVAWTFAYYMLSAVEARRILNQGPWGPDEAVDISDPRNWFSPDFLYSQRDTLEERMQTAPKEPLCFEPDQNDEGQYELGCMRPEKALRLLMERGACKWDWMCEDVATRQYGPCLPVEAVDDTGPLPDVLGRANLRSRRAWQPSGPGAEWFKPDCYVRFGTLDESGELRLDKTGLLPLVELRSWLHDEGTPIGIVVQMHDGWMTYRGGNKRDVVVRNCFPCDIVERRGVCLEATGRDLGSQHMMTIVGYDDDFPSPEQYPGLPPEKRGSFLVANQFGTKWGDQGMMWIPYAELRKIWIAGYGLVGGIPGRKLREDGIARTACAAIDNACTNTGEPCAQDDLDGDWKNLGPDQHADDVPRVLGPGGTPIPNPDARELTDGGSLFGDLADENLGDWYWFEVTTPNTAVEVSLSKSSGDPLALKLVDADQRRLATSGSESSSVFESLSRVICEPGLYYVKVFKYGTAAAAPYFVGLALDAAVGNDDVCTATPIPLTEAPLAPLPTPFDFIGKPSRGGQVDDTLGAVDEVTGRRDLCDWFAVALPAGQALDLTLAADTIIGFDAWRGESPDTAEFVGRSRRPLGAWQHAYLSLPPRPGTQLFIRVFFDLDEGEDLAPGFIEGYTLEVRTRAEEASDDMPGGAQRLAFLEMPGRAGCWQAVTDGVTDREDPIDFHRLVAPAGARVIVRLTTQDPLCASSLINDDVLLRDWVCVRLDNETEFELEVPPDGGCREILLSLSPEDTWFRLEDVEGGPYTLTVEICLDDREPVESVDVPPEDASAFLGRGARPQGVVGGGDPVDWYLYESFGFGGSFMLWLTDVCEDLELHVIDANRGGVVQPESERVVLGGIRRVYANPGAGDLWVRVRSASNTATSYTLWFLGFAFEERAGWEDGGDDRPQSARTTLAYGGTAREEIGFFDDRDYWRVPIPGPDGSVVPFQVNLTVPDDGEGARLSVWDGNGHLLGTKISEQGENLRLALKSPAGSSILILVDEVPGPAPRGEYELRVGATN